MNMMNLTQVKQMGLDEAIEQALIAGDLSALTTAQRLEYYKAVCASLNLNSLTKPFDYIELWDSEKKRKKLVLYPNGQCADQLRAIHAVSITRLEKRTEDGLYEVTAYGALPNGRTDQASAYVAIENLKGADRANAKMKTETKAKRRLSLSLVGLSAFGGVELTDEQITDYKEIETVPEIAEREALQTEERAARPRSEWTEELDENVREANNEPAPRKPIVSAPPVFTIPEPPEFVQTGIAIPTALSSLLKSYRNKVYAPANRTGAQGLLNGILDEYAGDTDRRHAFLMAMFNTDTSNNLKDGEIAALLAWRDHPQAKSEVNRVIADYLVTKGQAELPIPA